MNEMSSHKIAGESQKGNGIEGASQGERRILLLASKLGYQTRSFAEAASRLGIAVTIGSDRCHQLDDPWSDGAIPLHFEEPEASAAAIEHAVRDKPVQAILALGDRQTITAAYAARALGIAYNSPESVENCRSKLRQREVLRTAGLRVPDFFSFQLPTPPMWPGQAAQPFDPSSILPQVQFPCVVKPLRLAASQGVIRANNAAEFAEAVARISRLLNSPEVRVTRETELDRVIVERYIPGTEVALEGLLVRGKLRVLAIFDKPDELTGPYFEESIYVTPSRLPPEMQSRIVECAGQMVRALGLTEGPLHAEFRIHDPDAGDGGRSNKTPNATSGTTAHTISNRTNTSEAAALRAGPWILEAAPRPIGGLCSRSLRFGTERMFLEELLVRHALGLPGADQPRESLAAGVMMIPVPASGILEAVEGVEDAGATPGVDEVQITARRHDYIAAWPEGSSYLGFIFARGKEASEVEDALRTAHRKLRIAITPRLPVAHPALPFPSR